jgi:alkylhydroperoxidase family enzyme
MKDDRQVVEAVLTVAGYNMVARTLIALDVDGASEDPVPIPH